MAGLPNPKNSELLEQLCRSFSLHDPYSVLFPTRKDYTYSPFGTVRLNRSRLDFFIISDSLINCISSCSIADSLSCKLFDHKQVHLVLYEQQGKQIGPLRLSNTYLNEKLLEFSVEIAARHAHVYSLLCQNNGMPNDIIRERNLIAIHEALLAYGSLTKSMLKNAATGGGDELTGLLVAGHERDLQAKLDDMTPISELEQLVKKCSDTEFFVALTEEIRTAGAKTQKFLGKLGKTEENAIRGKLDALKTNYLHNANEIATLENKLKIKKDLLLRDKL
jgi:hypothetical protein